MEKNFKDYFSGSSKDYSNFRPDYPEELFSFLSAMASEHETAWDCATGNGQAARMLAKYFKKVIATDASQDQISRAHPAENIEYMIALAENSGLKEKSIDLITVAQAFHWFDFEEFFKEVRRVLKDNGVIAIWAYGLSNVNPEIDNIVYNFYQNILGDYWPKERKYVDEKYESIPFPFEEIPMDKFIIRKVWDLNHFLGYLNSWSSVKKYQEKNKTNPVELIFEELEKLWKEPRAITWPIYLHTGIYTND